MERNPEQAFQELAPHPALRPFVDRLWTRSAPSPAGTAPVRILPDGCIDLIVDITRGCSATAVGTMTRATVFEPGEPTRLVGVRFRPGGAVPFFGTPADELTDRVVDAGALGIRWLSDGQLADHGHPAAAVRRLERALLARLHAVAAPDRVVAYAVSALCGPVPSPVAALADDIGWSRQHLGRVLRRDVGVGPKRLARVARLQRAVDRLQRGEDAGLADTAILLGYFDQAHMNRDFRELAGVTPRTASATAGSIRPIRSLFGEA